MHCIGNVIVGTYVPWSREDFNKVGAAYAADADFVKKVQEFNPDDNQEMLLADVEQGELDWLEFVEDVWTKEYHGGGNSTVAWVGVCIGTFDETDHFDLNDIKRLDETEVFAEAMDKYRSLPQTVRDLLPPFGTYVVWSSS